MGATRYFIARIDFHKENLLFMRRDPALRIKYYDSEIWVDEEINLYFYSQTVRNYVKDLRGMDTNIRNTKLLSFNTEGLKEIMILAEMLDEISTEKVKCITINHGSSSRPSKLPSKNFKALYKSLITFSETLNLPLISLPYKQFVHLLNTGCCGITFSDCEISKGRLNHRIRGNSKIKKIAFHQK